MNTSSIVTQGITVTRSNDEEFKALLFLLVTAMPINAFVGIARLLDLINFHVTPSVEL